MDGEYPIDCDGDDNGDVCSQDECLPCENGTADYAYDCDPNIDGNDSCEECCDNPVNAFDPGGDICECQSYGIAPSDTSRSYTYTSSDSSVVSVNSSGTVFGESAGTATITVSDSNNPNCYDTVSITVASFIDKCKSEPSKGTLSVSGTVSIDVGTTYSPSSSDLKQFIYGTPKCGSITNACNSYLSSCGRPQSLESFGSCEQGIHYSTNPSSFTPSTCGDQDLDVYAEIPRADECVNERGGDNTVTVLIGTLTIRGIANANSSLDSPRSTDLFAEGDVVDFTATGFSNGGSGGTFTWGGDIGGTGSHITRTLSDSGSKTVIMDYSDSCTSASQKSVTFNVVGVGSLVAEHDSQSVTSDAISQADAEVLLVGPGDSGGTITVTANAYPAHTSWPVSSDGTKYPIWTNASNSNSSVVEILVDDVLDVGSIVVAASCGSSTKYIRLLNVDLEEVSFLPGSVGTNYHELTKDTDTDFKYSKPHWVDSNGDGDTDDPGDKNYPVAFTCNTKPTLQAKIDIGNAFSGQTIQIRATGPGAIAIPATTATVNGSTVTLPATESTGAFVDTIKFYSAQDAGNEFELTWEMQIGSSTWFEVGKSKHTLYLTLNDPITTLRQETLFNIGCRNADGMTNGNKTTIDSIYSEYTDQEVSKVQPGTGLLETEIMTYWLNDQMSCVDTPELLSRSDRNGNCQAWSGFFRDVLRVQGIAANRFRVWRDPDSDVIAAENLLGIFGLPRVAVKDWVFTGSGTSGNPNYPYTVDVDANDINGVPGQGNSNPPRWFNGHWITEAADTLYDPSYGTPEILNASSDAGKKNYEDGAFDGYLNYKLVQSGGNYSIQSIIIRKNDTSSSSQREVNTYDAN